MTWFIYMLTVLHGLLAIGITLRILWRDDLTSSARLAWFILVVFLPYLGVALFVFFGESRMESMVYKRRHETWSEIWAKAGAELGNSEVLESQIPRPHRSAFCYARSVNGFYPTCGNRAELLPDDKVARSRLIEDIDAAQHHVNILYYIWLADKTGTNVAKAVIRAAKRGVRCRVMADGMGSRRILHKALWQEMKDAGVETCVALPYDNLIRTIVFGRIDLRNHRKITVIDGRITYCGSQNCADPEYRVKPRFAPWVDIVVRLEGPVVAQNQILFASDWMLHKPDATIDEFTGTVAATDDNVIAQVFGDGPTERKGATAQLFATLMSQAQRELIISTPYFVPDQTVLDAICATGYRGVEVTLILPMKNDSRIVAAVSHSYYRRLLAAGVRLYEFRPGLLHSKTLTIDGEVTLIGSTNLDLRSFDLNYENDILFYDKTLTQAVKKRQHDYLAESVQIHLQQVLAWPPHRRLWNNVVATVDPIL